MQADIFVVYRAMYTRMCFYKMRPLGQQSSAQTHENDSDLRSAPIDFVVTAAPEAALRVIEQAEVVRLSLTDQECFARALLSPPEPVSALKRAFARRRTWIRAE